MLFNKDFMLGAATAAHQVEGNNVGSDYWIMENLEHSVFVEKSGLAVDHYNRYEEDIDLLKQSGLNAYRFSIEWARIEPVEGQWNEKEMEHYIKVIDYCLANGIEPVVTYHHFSSPAWLITKGGWESPDVVRYFERYAKYVTEHVAGKVKYVCTINEANMRLQMAFLIKDITERMSKQSEIQNQEGSVQVGVNLSQNQSQMMMSMMETAKAFNIDDPRKVANFVSQASEEGDLLVMKAHNAARNAIKSVDPSIQVGLTLSLHDIQCVDGGEENAKKAWDDEFTHYLPYIEKDDFLGVQCYTRKIFDANGANSTLETGPKTQMGYEDYPMGIVNVVRRCAEEFKGAIIVTENGIATSDDERRCEFIKEALTGLNDCITEGIKLKGYFAWSLLDNFEWQKGFSMTFGLISVDRNTMERTPKNSLKVLGSFIEA
ncbi:beta-glucosidase [Pseudobutyrivibrio sp. JW11]|uniref:glycoside hydrolase family 1 protein n=1 Tax=Pseudobutyrivibrio sp. JW11 TaxID=1855302 RepID=UPI0008E80A07|nr:family 1 glycosylhydrolase [Pseudobutyrivibrio sp. JW11]SFN86790.1 beta-glucosidase [Pseudobutyrivibrio sp. JW11]